MMRVSKYLILIFLWAGCGKGHMDDCFTSTGDVELEERSVGHFTTLIVNDNVDVVITQGTEDRVVIEAGENLMRHIEVVTEGGALHLSNTNKCNWVRSFKVPVVAHVTTTSLNFIHFHGTGNITGTNTINTTKFEVEALDAGGSVRLDLQVDSAIAKVIRGVADITYTGTANAVILFTQTPGHMNSEHLITPYSFVTAAGTGDIRTYASQELHAFIEYVGDVYYGGDPSNIFPSITGSGELVKVD